MRRLNYRRHISVESDLADRPLSWGELEAAHRRRRLAWSALSVTARTALLIAAYYVAPFEDTGGSSVGLRVVISLLIVAGAATIALLGILKADHPILRAIEGMMTLIVITILAFASTYVLMSRGDPTSFSEAFNHTGALYFALTTATTIGFGDITPSSDGARIVVMVQMVVNVALLGVGIRVMLNTAKRRARSV